MMFSEKILENNIVIGVLVDDLVSSNVIEIENHLKKIPKKNKNILLDFNNVVSIDTNAITELINLKKKCNKSKVYIAIFTTSSDLIMIFHITKLNELIDVYNSEQEALWYLEKKKFKIYC